MCIKERNGSPCLEFICMQAFFSLLVAKLLLVSRINLIRGGVLTTTKYLIIIKAMINWIIQTDING